MNLKNLYIFIYLLTYAEIFAANVLNYQQNLPDVKVRVTNTNLGITDIILDNENFPVNSRLEVIGSMVLWRLVNNANEVLYEMNWTINGTTSIVPTGDIVFIPDSEEGPTVKIFLNIFNNNGTIVVIGGGFIKAGSINEGDILPQNVLVKHNDNLGPLPLRLNLEASSQQSEDMPVVRVNTILSYVY